MSHVGLQLLFSFFLLMVFTCEWLQELAKETVEHATLFHLFIQFQNTDCSVESKFCIKFSKI